MGWRERFGGDDERAQIAARARQLLATAVPPAPVPPPVLHAPVASDAGSEPPPPRRGGWVPTVSALGMAVEPAVGRHAVATERPLPLEPEVADVAGWRPPHLDTDHADTGSSWRDRIRFDPGRRGLVAVAAVVVVVGSIAGGVLVRGGPSSAVTVAAASGLAPSAASAAPVAGRSDPGPSPSVTSSGTSSPTAGTVTVDVAGLVVHPGVYTLPAGSRVEDALRVAGGAQPTADLSTLNRARVLVDGEQLAVGVPGAVGGAGSSGSATTAGAAGPAGLVDLNTASPEQLDTLPGVGPVLAQAIVGWRTDHGRFASVDDLQQVSGIGPAKFADIKALVTV